eukprot:6622458-Heterocapsa_arctica.AAC.1
MELHGSFGSHTQGVGGTPLVMWAVTGSSSGLQQSGGVWDGPIQDTPNQEVATPAPVAEAEGEERAH